jgi:hypothetical protein
MTTHGYHFKPFLGVCDELIRSLSRGSPGQKTWLLARSKNMLIARTSKVSEDITRLTKEFKSVRPISVDNCLTNMLNALSQFSEFDFAMAHVQGEFEDFLEREEIKVNRFFTDLRSELKKGKFLNIYWFDDNHFFDCLAASRSYLIALQDCVPDFSSRFPGSTQESLFHSLSKVPYSSFISVFKYCTACPQAHFLKQELPPRPDGFTEHWLLWKGNIKRFLKNVFNRPSSNKLGQRLSWTILQGVKRGCNQVPESFIYKEIESHVKAMVTPAETQPELDRPYYSYDKINGLVYDPQAIMVDPIDELLPLLSKEYPIKSDTPEYQVELYEPSHSSSFELSLSKGGQYASIIDQTGSSFTEDTDGVIDGSDFIVTSDGLRRNSKWNLTYEKVRSTLQTQLEAISFKSDFPELSFGIDYSHPKNKEIDPSHKFKQVSVVGIAEPLKVRVITKGNSLPMYYTKSFQKTLFNKLKKLDCFVALTRSNTLNQADIYKLIDKEKALNLDFPNFVSGDYKAATDKLNIRLTKAVFEHFLKYFNVNDFDSNIFRSVLYEQEVSYPRQFVSRLRKNKELSKYNISNDKKSFRVRQANGQLMGSIVSFPVLCIVNLLCYHASLNEYLGSYVPISKLPCLVNGDDILFKADDRFYQIWRSKIDLAGFKLSVGKNYVHPKIFTINSKCYTFFGGRLDTVGFLNVGLLTGQSKGGTFLENLPLWDIFNKITDPIEGCANRPLLIQHFLRYHKDEINKLTHLGEFNLFLSKMLGGIGFILPPDCLDSVNFTHFQRSLAAYLNRSWKSIQDKPYKFGRSKSCPKLEFINVVNTSKPEVHTPYTGPDIIMAVPITQPNPRGFGKKVDPELPIMTANPYQESFRPKLKQQVFSRNILKNFRVALKSWHQEMDIPSCKYHAQGYNQRIVYRQFSCPVDAERARIKAYFQPAEITTKTVIGHVPFGSVPFPDGFKLPSTELIFLCGDVKTGFSDELTIRSRRTLLNTEIIQYVERLSGFGVRV